jgi:cob(I)alamin adenosyltransferase
MVYLSRIYTKAGDRGETGLGDGSRVPKDHPRVIAYGEVDELNAVLGLVKAAEVEPELLPDIQNDLFDVGADLCVRGDAGLRVTARQTQRLEEAIDRVNERLTPLTSFVLPGGTVAAAWLHVARAVCRRAERAVVTLMRTEAVNENALVYLNRLSDLLFVLARAANDDGKGDVLWVPGQGQAESKSGS